MQDGDGGGVFLRGCRFELTATWVGAGMAEASGRQASNVLPVGNPATLGAELGVWRRAVGPDTGQRQQSSSLVSSPGV